MESEIQDLSFRSAMVRKNARATRRWDTSMLRTPDGAYSNLALILSDQCPWRCEIRSDGRDEQNIGGSVIEQLNTVGQIVAAIRRRQSAESGREITKIQTLAFSEILLNAVCHRSYCDPSPIIVDVGPESTVITSPGGMMRLGVSYRERTRNLHLAEMLEGIEMFQN